MSALFGELGTPIVCPECGQPDRSTPTSGNDEVETLCQQLEALEHAWCDRAAALIRKQAAEIAATNEVHAEIMKEACNVDYGNGKLLHCTCVPFLRETVRKQAAQIAELQKERAEILRISGLVWPPSTSIAGKGGL